jgi:hypothetical protein
MLDPTPFFKALWLAWGIIWLLAVPWSARAAVRQSATDRLRHFFPLLLGGSLFLVRTSPTTFLGRRIVSPGRGSPGSKLR